MNQADRIPAIDILIGSFDGAKCEVPEKLAEQIAHGIEEEGMTFRILFQNPSLSHIDELIRHTHLWCQSSVLGVAIGINQGAAILHDKKMKEQNPVFIYQNDFHAKLLRTVGQNAARLVKCIPFIYII